MAIFNSYVSLPEGNPHEITHFFRNFMADQVLEDPKGSDLGFVALGLRGQPSLPGATGLELGGMKKMGPEQAKKM